MTTHTPHPRIAERAQIGIHSTQRDNLDFNGRLAVRITKLFGTMTTFYLFIIWMFGWMFLATIGFGFFKLDPYPFTFLLFLSNLVQLFALPILAVGQQVLSRASDKQAEQTFKDAEAILKIQDELHHLIKVNNELTQQIHDAVLKKQV